METSSEVACRPAVIIRVLLAAILVLIAAPASAGPLLSINMGPGGKVHTGIASDPDAVRGIARDLGSMISGVETFQIMGGNLWFNSAISVGNHHLNFFAPGQQLLMTGWIDNHHNGIRDSQDVRGTLIAAKLLNYRFLDRNGKTFLIANVLETINPKLAAVLGLDKTTYNATLELQLSQIRTGRYGRQVYDAIEGGVLTTDAVPEPSSIVLLGIPLLWFGVRGLQRLRASAGSILN